MTLIIPPLQGLMNLTARVTQGVALGYHISPLRDFSIYFKEG